MLRTRRGPHSESMAKLGVNQNRFLTPGPHSPRHAPARLLCSLGPCWGLSQSPEGKHFSALPPSCPPVCQHNIKVNLEVNKFTKRNRTFKKENRDAQRGMPNFLPFHN